MYDLNYINEIEREEFKAVLDRQYFQDRELLTEQIERGVILPYVKAADGLTYGGVTDSDGKFLELSRDEEITGSDFTNYPYTEREEITYLDEDVIYLGPYKEQWGHFITSVISRLWYITKNPKDKVKIAYPAGEYSFRSEGIRGNYLGFLKLLGFQEDRIIRVEEPIRFRRIVVAERAHVPETYYTSEFRDFYEDLKSRVRTDLAVYSKIYLTRCGNETLDSHDFGEEQLKEVFEKNGFHVLEPSAYTIEEQIWIIKNADVIATVSGSLTHNLVFAKDGVELIILRRQGYPMLTHLFQGAINHMRKAKVTHIETSIRLLPVNGAGPNIFYISEELIRYLKDKEFEYIPEQKQIESWRRYLVLIWYFLRWLDIHCKQNPLRLKRLEGQFYDNAIVIYGYYREKMDWYDGNEGTSLRKLFYNIVKKYGKY